jgi:hypothetical protein
MRNRLTHGYFDRTYAVEIEAATDYTDFTDSGVLESLFPC